MVLVMDLLTDNIASVRLQAAHLAASITEHLIKGKPQNTEIANEFVENVSKNYNFFFHFCLCLDYKLFSCGSKRFKMGEQMYFLLLL